tara:strand:+ start:102 stop:572 length:471 start_codon:yes stop_codon:yes gene_type:complete
MNEETPKERIKLKNEKQIKAEFREQIAKIKVLVEVQPTLSDYLNPIIAELIELNEYPRTATARMKWASPEKYKERIKTKRTPEAQERYRVYNKLRGLMLRNGTWDKYMVWRNANKTKGMNYSGVGGKKIETMEDMYENNKTDLEVMKEFCEGKREE